MRRLLLASLLLALTSSSAAAQSAIIDSYASSVLRVESSGSVCTGFVIDSVRRYILTAAHCFDPGLVTVDGDVALVVFVRRDYDLMVLQTSAQVGGAFIPGDVPDVLAEVATIGYGYGSSSLIFRHGHVSAAPDAFPELGGRFLLIDSAAIPGQSGGPVVDRGGKVVGVMQRSNAVMAVARPIDDVVKVVRKYFSKP